MAAHGKKFSFGRLINNAFPNFAHDDPNDVNLSPAQADQVSGTDDAGKYTLIGNHSCSSTNLLPPIHATSMKTPSSLPAS
jgi:hypothetical protein